MSDPSRVNRQQAEHWNAAAGRTWVEMQHVLDEVFAPIAARIVEAGDPGAGGRVVDLGCGAGATTIQMARRLGEAGRCLGVDISQPLVDAALRRRREAGVPAADFVVGDAQVYPFATGDFDAAISRFGVMFFADPVAAFANVRRAVRAGGKLAFAAWRAPAENPFMTAAAKAAAPLLPGFQPPDPDAPGQFAFAQSDHVRRILAASGWTDVAISRLDAPASLAAADLISYVSRMGPVGQALQGLDEERRAPIVEAVLKAYDPFVRDGVATFDLACWLVTARA